MQKAPGKHRGGKRRPMAIAQTLAAWAGECVRNGRRQALPPAAYSDGEMLALERRQIFARAWIAVAHISQLRAVGDYITFEIAGHPVLAVHGADGKLRAFSNVCQHHSAPVAAGSGRRTVFRCPYHAWTYGLDGALLGAPYMDKAALGGIALPPLALETWQGLVFVNLDAAAPPLAPALTALEPRIAPLALERQQTVLCEDLEMACNWKLLVENFCESYHVFSVHKATLEQATPTASIENRAGGDAFNHHIQRTSDAFSLAAGRQLGLDRERASEDHLICIYPALALNIVGGSALWLSVMPTGPAGLKARMWQTLLPDADGHIDDEAIREAGAAVHAFMAEDRAVIEAVQKGLAAGAGNRAPLHPWEDTNWQFSRYLLRQLGIAAADVPATALGQRQPAGRAR